MRLLVSALLTLFALPIAAHDRVGRDLIIPVVGRVGGWKTDVVITNAATSGEPIEVGLLIPGIAFTFVSVTLAPGETSTQRDAVKGGGIHGEIAEPLSYIRLASSDPDAKLVAYARIYKGDVGQIVHAIPASSLGRTALLNGISGGEHTHTNAGFVALLYEASDVVLTLLDAKGATRATRRMRTERNFTAIYDVRLFFGVTSLLEGDSLRIESTEPVIAFASIVNETSGDGDLVQSAAIDLPSNEVVTPACANPARLALARFPSRGFIVVYKPGTNAAARTAELATKYAFTPRSIYDALGGFFATELTQQSLAGLRCESDVDFIEENSTGFPI